MLRCTILDDYQKVALEMADWSALAGKVEIEVLNEHIADRDRLAHRLEASDIVVAMRERTPFQRDLLTRLPRLRLLVTTGMHNASIDLQAARGQGIVVCGTSGSSHSTAELAWALLLAVMRQVPAEDRNFKAGGPWQLGIGRELAGLTLGIVGLGRLGGVVARYGTAFGMNVTAWSRSLTSERAKAAGATLAPSLAELMRVSDAVTLHLPLTPQSRGLIGAAELALMKPDAVLINTSRGPIVDEPALVAALKEKRIAGAGLDVYDVEPLPADHPLRGFDNVVATPHLGYVTQKVYRGFYAHIVEDIAGWLAGAPVRVLTG